MKGKILTILLVVFVALLLVVLYINHKRHDKLTFNDNDENNVMAITAYQLGQSFSNMTGSDPIGSPFSEVLEENNIRVAERFDEANLIFFSDFSLIDQNVLNIPFQKRTKRNFIYAICGSDELANKANLALYMQQSGQEKYIPRSYILGNTESMNNFVKEHKDGNIYMLKKNVQRQEGNLITTDVTYIMEKSESADYVVCQELLQNPYTVGGRKINMRIYMLIVVENGVTSMYIYNNGFMYYTPQQFVKGSTEKDVNVTTGYIDRKVYEENPLTIQDLFESIGEEKSVVLQKNMIDLFSAIKGSYAAELTKLNADLPGTKFNIYGVDVAPDEDLNVILIEVNKGPDLTYKDERDKNVKLAMVRDCLTLVGIGNRGTSANFIKL
jgi:hypothetical protein